MPHLFLEFRRRTAIAGIPHFWCDDTVAAAAREFCLTTHAEPRCAASCVVVALCVSRLLRGEDDADIMQSVVQPALVKAQEWLDAAAKEEMNSHARATLEDLALDDRKTIGFTLKCLGAGLWALRQGDGGDRGNGCDGHGPRPPGPRGPGPPGQLFRKALNELILAAGDADTNAAVAGALLGCRLGFSQLPADRRVKGLKWGSGKSAVCRVHPSLRQDWIAGMPYSSWLEAYVQKILFMLQRSRRSLHS